MKIMYMAKQLSGKQDKSHFNTQANKLRTTHLPSHPLFTNPNSSKERVVEMLEVHSACSFSALAVSLCAS